MIRCLILLLLSCNICFSQTDKDSADITTSYDVFYANRLSTHPFGVITSRTNHNFQTGPAKKISLSINISSGNVWLPYVKAYQPLREDDRNVMRTLPWHERDAHFDQSFSPSESFEFHADGVIRFYHVTLNIPLAKKHDLNINTRMFSLDEGRVPYSTLTSDRLIEWFHSNIYGGEDPFARKVYGLEKAKIHYVDENGKTLEMQKGGLAFSGIDVSYSYYPDFMALRKRGLFTNFGLQLGGNLHQSNPSLDLGLFSSLIKKIKFRNRHELHLGGGISALHLNLLNNENALQLSNKKLLLSSEFLISYIIPNKRNGYFSIATTYFIQSSYNQRKDFETIVLSGERYSTHWHYSISHLYRPLTTNYLIITWATKGVASSIYLREDFLVDNAPDTQVGIGIRVSF